MRIRNNGPASRSYRSYRTNSGALAKTLEKLSSGYKINRAADGAAELTISEKMRAQITGLDGAQQNAKHGIGLIQVTEGALQEYHKIVNRMLELSVKSANATYDDEVDRQQLQKEMNRLAQELDRIADSTNFNGIYTLKDGYVPETNSTAEAISDDITADLSGGDIIDEIEAAELLDTRLEEEGARSGEIQFSLIWEGSTDLDLHCHTPNRSHIYYGQKSAGGGELDVDAQAQVMMEHPVENIYFDEPSNGDYSVFVHNYSRSETVDKAFVRIKVGDETSMYSLGPLEPKQYYDVIHFTYSEEPPNLTLIEAPENVELLGHTKEGTSAAETENETEVTEETEEEENDDNKIRLQIGETSDEYNVLEVPKFGMHADRVGLGGVDISTQSGALDAIDKIKGAVSKVADVRGTYGALQNRLEHTINYLGNAKENVQSAESLIRDTDMADEMMKYTKNTILTQAAQSMMAQANMLPEGVLKLLQ